MKLSKAIVYPKVHTIKDGFLARSVIKECFWKMFWKNFGEGYIILLQVLSHLHTI